MITTAEIKQKIKEAIKLFGEYSYFDKGPQEVMDMEGIIKRFSDMSPKQVADVLAGIRKQDKEYGERFVEEMLYCLQDEPRMDLLYEDKRISDLY